MPLRIARPIVRVEPGSMHDIETHNPENLFGLWSVFSKCSLAMEDGRRYENIAWRLWSRETLCCASDHLLSPSSSFLEKRASNDLDLPELSSSVESDSSRSETASSACTTSRSNSNTSRPDLRRNDSTESRTRGREKHITPIDLEKVVSSIQEKKILQPLSPLPSQLAHTLPLLPTKPAEDTTPRPSSPPPTARLIPPESSTSTVATVLGSDNMSPPFGSDVSTSTDFSTHSVVKGFSPGHISTSIRSSTNLNPTPILKSSMSQGRPEPIKADPAKKKQPMFTLGGGSSDEDNTSSLEASYMANRSALSDSLRQPTLQRKTTSFKNEVVTRTIQDAVSSEESAIESDSEDEDSDDPAIEDDDGSDDDEWEDEDASGPSSIIEREMRFPRVDSKPNLTSHRSALTLLMHDGQFPQNAASRSSPAIRRSRATTPNGPSTGNSPQEDSGLMMRPQTRSKPIIMTTSNVHPPALSPRTTRRNMLQTELTESLRKNLLWERQQKNSTTNAVNKRQSTTNIPALRRAATTSDIKGLNAFPREGIAKAVPYRDMAKNNNSYNDYFDQGLQEYHQKGW